jgi:hypothetical protein
VRPLNFLENVVWNVERNSATKYGMISIDNWFASPDAILRTVSMFSRTFAKILIIFWVETTFQVRVYIPIAPATD